MKARMVIDEASYSRVQVGLKNIAEKVPDHAARTMRRAAARIVKEAKILVPEDTTALRESIRFEEHRGDRRRLEISIIAGGDALLDQYAAIVHEAYELMLAYGPGEGTQAKMERYPDRRIGSGFISRAVEKEEKTLVGSMIDDIKKVIKTENMG